MNVSYDVGLVSAGPKQGLVIKLIRPDGRDATKNPTTSKE